MTGNEPQTPRRQRTESEYPAEVRRAGRRGQDLYDACVAALEEDGMPEREAAMIALLHFPELFARLAPEDTEEPRA